MSSELRERKRVTSQSLRECESNTSILVIYEGNWSCFFDLITGIATETDVALSEKIVPEFTAGERASDVFCM